MPIAGVLKSSSMGIKNNANFSIYVENEIIMELVDKYKPSSSRICYLIDSDDYKFSIDKKPSDKKVLREIQEEVWTPKSYSIKVINLDSKYGTLVSLEMSLLVFNCPRVLPNNLNNEIPEEVNVVDVNPQLAYMSKEDFESSGIFMLSEYLDNKYNSNRRNTSIPFAQISNIAVNAIPERPNSLEVTYDVTNYLQPNLNGKNSEFLLSNILD